jgi:hypothetical protein
MFVAVKLFMEKKFAAMKYSKLLNLVICCLRSLGGLHLYGTLGYIWFELKKNKQITQN